MDASIWDQPVVQLSPRRAEKSPLLHTEDGEDVPQRPRKRARQTLFLADSDEEEDNLPGPSKTETVLQAPPPQDIDIEALFADVDDPDNEISRPLPAILDEEELTRQAEARYRKNLTPHEILPSSSPAREQEGKNVGKKGREKGKDDDEKKSRRRQLKLDENLLLSPTGFPQLIKMTKDFRIKGKGHEAADLDRLLRIYQYWTHRLYPKTTFKDTVERVEKLCHSRRMNVSLSVWRDEAHGKFNGHLDINDSADEDEQTQDNDQNIGDTRRSVARSSSPITLSDVRTGGPSLTTTRNDSSPEDDDTEFWKTIDAGMEASLSDIPSAPPTSGPNSSMDEDEDMWDVANEVERNAENTATNTAEIAVASGPLPQNHPSDDDLDDMYE